MWEVLVINGKDLEETASKLGAICITNQYLEDYEHKWVFTDINKEGPIQKKVRVSSIINTHRIMCHAKMIYNTYINLCEANDYSDKKRIEDLERQINLKMRELDSIYMDFSYEDIEYIDRCSCVKAILLSELNDFSRLETYKNMIYDDRIKCLEWCYGRRKGYKDIYDKVTISNGKGVKIAHYVPIWINVGIEPLSLEIKHIDGIRSEMISLQ